VVVVLLLLLDEISERLTTLFNVYR